MKELLLLRGRRALQIGVGIMAALLWGCAAQLEPPKLPENQAPGDYSYLKSYLTELIQVEMKRYKLSGLSIAVVDDQETVWAEGFGYAEKATRRAANANTVYRIGSITKLFTATAIMQLVENGLVDIDNPIKTYLPEFSIRSRFPDMREPTVRDLLTHHSGLPSDRFRDWAWDAPPPEGYDTVFLELPGQMTKEYMAQPPGTIFAYCNLGFSLLGNIIARVSGESYPDYIENHILAPLGMNRSSVIVNDKVRDLLAMGYMGRKPTETPYIRDLAAGSMLSSVADLAKFMTMLFADGSGGEGQILKPETLGLMFKPQNEDVVLDLDFRIGLTYWLVNPLRIESEQAPASHGGDLPPYHGLLLTLPGEQLGVVVLSNANQSAGIIQKITIEALALAHEIKTGKRRLPEETSPVVAFSEKELATLGGSYASPMGFTSVTVKGQQVHIRMMGIKLGLVPHENGDISTQFRLLGLIPLKIEALDAIKFRLERIAERRFLSLYMGGIFLGFAEKIESVFIPEAWIARCGKYDVAGEMENPAIRDFALSHDSRTGLLLLKMKFLGSSMAFPLEPLSDTEAISMGTGRNLGETIWIENRGEEEFLHFSGFELKRRK